MRAAVLHTPGDIRLEEVDKPTPGAGEVLLRVAAVGVCGSDLPRMLTKGAHKMPLICGHEFSGHIEELGPEVSGFQVGQLCAVPPMLPCYDCDQCKTGNYSRCRDYDYFGSRRDGAYAEWVVVPVSNLLAAPLGIDPQAVAMIDPASIALHAIWKAGGVQTGDRGAVIGCGAIGLFAIQWMLLMGAKEVVAIDVSEEKLDLARKAGAAHCYLASADIPADLRANITIEAAGHPTSINSAIQIAAPGGHVGFIGIPVGDVPISNAAFQHVLRQEISLHGAWNSFGAPYPGPQWTVALDKLGSGDLKYDFIISHNLTLDELPEMFDRLKNERGLFFSKIMFQP